MICKPIISVTLVSEAKDIFLVKYKRGPDGQSGWFVPNDLLEEGELPEAAAGRIIKEHIGVDLNAVFSHFEVFKGQDSTWHLGIHYTAKVSRKFDSAAEFLHSSNWFASDALPAQNEVAHGGWALSIIEKCNFTA